MTRATLYTVVGDVACPQFHKCCALATNIAQATQGANVSLEPLFETDWDEVIEEKRRSVGGNAIYDHTEKYAVFVGQEFLGDADDLLSHAKRTLDYEEATVLVEGKHWEAVTRTQLRQCTSNPLVHLDFDFADGNSPRRVVFELSKELCPETSENFRALCTGEKGSSDDGHLLCYKGSPIHRVVKGGWVQGGDIVQGRGDGGVSIYGETFADETFDISFDSPGILAMASSGPHTNASQFFVTLAPQPWLRYRAVGFGRVVAGMRVLKDMEKLDALNERPRREVTVASCGELDAMHLLC
jgi:peptidyl-prolyl cis-trans isomerase-like 6